MSTISYYTEEGLKRLKDELEQLKFVERPSISNQISEARDKGDLSENAEYDAAKEAQGMLEMKIAKLEGMYSTARVIDESLLDTDKVLALSIVKIKNVATKMDMTVTLVAESEANIKTGRISINSPIGTGLLLFTNDTDLAKKLGASKKNIKEIYQITLDKNLSQVHLENIREGVFMNGRTINLDSISYINGKDKNEIGIENSNGGIKLVKQLFEKINYKIIKLDRVFLGGLTKKDLPRKHYRHLTQDELNILRRL